MLLWFAGVSFVAVWLVFRSPALDYRLVMLGAVLPAVASAAGGPRILDALIVPVAALVVVMLATRSRRLLRRRLLGLPIGALVYLVLDGAWADTATFWWPVFGWHPEGEVLEWGRQGAGSVGLDRPVAVVVLMEAVGAACLVWAYRTFRLDDPQRRSVFLRTGRLDRAVTP